jgi:hypothetical protein
METKDGQITKPTLKTTDVRQHQAPKKLWVEQLPHYFKVKKDKEIISYIFT